MFRRVLLKPFICIPLKLFATKQLPSFKSITELLQYTSSNKARLSPAETFTLFNTMFSLEHPSALQKISAAQIFVTDPAVKTFVDSLQASQLVKVAKRYSQLKVQPGPEWKHLLEKILGKIKDLSADELYDFMRFSLEPLSKDPDNPIWKKMLDQMALVAGEYNPTELVIIIKVAAALRVPEDGNFWKAIDEQVLKKLDEMKAEEIAVVFMNYTDIERNVPEVTQKLRAAMLNKMP